MAQSIGAPPGLVERSHVQGPRQVTVWLLLDQGK